MRRHVGSWVIAVVTITGATGRAAIKPVVASGSTDGSGNPVQVAVPLAPGEVFVVTSWSAVFAGTTSAKEVSLSSGAVRVDSIAASGRWSGQHHFNPGIVFPRDGAGLSDSYVASFEAMPIALQGYTANEGELLGVGAQTPAAGAISLPGLVILALLLGAAGMVVMRRRPAIA